MGATKNSPRQKDLLDLELTGNGWEPINHREAEPSATTSGASASITQILHPFSSPISSTRPPTTSNGGWQLPLEIQSLNYDSPEIPLSFLNIYPAILQKFPGPPCEALGRCISYLQALFSESPAFHPYITHLPSTCLPTDEIQGRHVAGLLERKLIRITDHLCAFFYGDIKMVYQYIESCRAELIPKPRFIISAKVPEGSKQSIPMPHGVDGFNNNIPGGAELWQSPVVRSPWRTQQEKLALQSNLTKIAIAVHAKRSVPKTRMEPPSIQPPLPPPVSVPQVPAPQLPLPTTAPIVRPPPRPQQPQAPAPRPPQIFHVHPMQPPAMQEPSPIPSAPRVIPPAPPVNRPHPPPSADPLREDIARLEAQVAKLMAIINPPK